MLHSLIAAAAAFTLSVSPVDFGLFLPAATDLSATSGAAFTPDGATVYIAKSAPGYSGLTIFASHRVHGSWSQPEVAPFSGVFRDTDPVVTPDGNAVVFSSSRPPSDNLYGYKLWIAYLQGPQKGTVEILPDSINADGVSLHASFASDGTLFFARSAAGVTRIYSAPKTGETYGTPHPIAFPDDTPMTRDGDPAIAPDQRYLVFAGSRPTIKASNALFVSFQRNGRWCTPIPLDAPVNTGLEFAPEISHDGRTLYFASARTSIVQPRATRADRAAFIAELAGYSHGAVRTYAVPIHAWIDAHTTDPC